MRRIFTFSFITIALVVASFNSFGQCTTGGTYTVGASYDFATNAQQFTGDFGWSNTAGGQLVSSNVSAGTTKVLTSPTFFQPATDATLYWEFDLSGAANVTSYTVEARYFNGSFQTVTVCSGGALANGNNLVFSAPAPAQILGQRFQLVITFTVSGSTNQTINIDNFSTSAQISNIVLPVKFSSLDARTTNNSVSLKWVVGSEDNVTGYEIEKSADGRNFSKIGFVGAAGHNSYSFVDTKSSSIAYYRIKSVDVSGRYSYSTVALVKAGKSMIILKAFPSPFSKSLSIQHATAVVGSLISISSEDGRIIKSVAPVAGTQQTDLDLSTAKPGLYLVRFSNGNGAAETLKILKQQ